VRACVRAVEGRGFYRPKHRAVRYIQRLLAKTLSVFVSIKVAKECAFVSYILVLLNGVGSQ
jgi:hypothetical protein